jgi:hypothetical protein
MEGIAITKAEKLKKEPDKNAGVTTSVKRTT